MYNRNMKTILSKEAYIILGNAYMHDEAFFEERYNLIKDLAKKYNHDTDFLGFTYEGGRLFNTVLDLLGDEFSYFYYDCDKSFKKYNENITFKDGSHPDIHNLGELWETENKL